MHLKTALSTASSLLYTHTHLYGVCSNQLVVTSSSSWADEQALQAHQRAEIMPCVALWMVSTLPCSLMFLPPGTRAVMQPSLGCLSYKAPTYTFKQGHFSKTKCCHSPGRAGKGGTGTGLGREEELGLDIGKSYSKVI